MLTCMQDRSTRKIVNPFGGGMRLCPGTDLAKLEATIFLHQLVLNYRYILSDIISFASLYILTYKVFLAYAGGK